MSSKPNLQLLPPLNASNDPDFKENLPNLSNDRLCEIIVCFRYLGLMEEESVLSMTELAARRANGDVFDFENRIIELTTDLPKINLDINKMLKSFRI